MARQKKTVKKPQAAPAAPKRPAAKTKPRNAEVSASQPSECPIIGLGASAGGLKAYTKFLEAMPSDSGMAFVLIQHLDPAHESLMASLLAGHTKMAVALAEDGMKVEPNSVYVIPPNATLLLEGNHLKVVSPAMEDGIRLPIDAFFRSLAKERRNQAIGIVMSGTGTDGTLGLKAIREAGGFAIAQEPSEAPHEGMPRNAIANGAVDEILPIAEIPKALSRAASHPYFSERSGAPVLGDRARSILEEIVSVLKQRKNVDFSAYKEGTLLRRIERRMGIQHLEDGTQYLNLVKENTDELERLSKDLLINVSDFFRDPEVFTYLEQSILPDLVKNHPADHPFRMWVAGCATGEEAYSYAMLLIEQAAAQKRHLKIQIFATDLDEDALAFARAGIYPESIERQISSARLARFFLKEDHRYHVKPELRDMIVFAHHNLLADAPFSKLDLVSCRNVLIYLDTKIQGRIIQLFHFSLNDSGVLILGTSETPNADETLFEPIARKHRIYKRKSGRSRPITIDMPISSVRRQSHHESQPAHSPRRLAVNPSDITKRILLERHAPAAVLVNAKSEGLYFSGPVDRYLRVPVGEAGQDLLAMVGEGLRSELRLALNAAKTTAKPAKSEGVWVTQDDLRRLVVIHVDPAENGEDTLYLVTFTDAAMTNEVAPVKTTEASHSVVAQLEKELQSTRRELKATIHDLEATNEELKAANEEAMSMNEEFQSTNEELETSKEELQSLNEELTTLNTQLQQKVDENRLMVDDLSNLLNSSQVATIFLDQQLRIKRFTPSAKELFNLIASDADRPFSDITHKLEDPDMLGEARKVLDNLSTVQREVQTEDDRWFIRRILPYRTVDNKVDGVVITLFEITAQKASQKRAEIAQEYAEAVIDSVRDPLIVLDNKLTIMSASKSYYDTFQTTREETEGKHFQSLPATDCDIPAMNDKLEQMLKDHKPIDKLELVCHLPSTGERTLLLNARVVKGGDQFEDLILLAFQDVTAEKTALEAINERNARLESIFQAAQLAIISINASGVIDSFSPAAETAFGYTAEEASGKNVNMLMPEPDHSRHDGYIATYLRTGKKSVIGGRREVTGRHKDGTLIPMELSVSETKFDRGRLFTGILRDLTVEKKRQEELIQAQKMEAMGQLTGGVAHDFNNLLTVILGNLELLESGQRPDLQEKLIGEIRGAVDLGADLTRGLLAFGRRLALRPETINTNDIVQQISGIIARTVPENIEIKPVLGKELWPVEVDAAQLQNALLNLCLNARDAMPSGGTCLIETSNVTLDGDTTLSQDDLEPGDYVAISVTDTGTGMAPETRKRAFEPFFTTKDVGEGSGLGLSMVYGFVKQSGGHAMITSDTGQGTTIRLLFPKQSASASKPETAPQKAAEPLQGEGETILVVEDDPRVRRVTVRRLELLGYHVLEAATGPEALDIMTPETRIDLLFTDIVMPGGLSGSDVAREGRRRNPGLKILLTSGYAEEALETEDEKNILRKPYSSEALAGKLREVLKT